MIPSSVGEGLAMQFINLFYPIVTFLTFLVLNGEALLKDIIATLFIHISHRINYVQRSFFSQIRIASLDETAEKPFKNFSSFFHSF